MVGFKALNYESDDDSEIDVDDTKEIQVEDALKEYQTALKHHAQGPKSFDEAQKAYETLFQSEVFKYSESQSEWSRAQLLGAEADYVPDWIYEQSDGPTGQAEGGPGTLPQLLHLAYKNRGQFALDRLQTNLKDYERVDGIEEEASQNIPVKIASAAKSALKDFAEALDKDDGDVDLWRRAAKVGNTLGSKRIARFCLEAALEGDNEDTDEVLGGSSIEAKVTKYDLRQLDIELQDDMSLGEDVRKMPQRPPPDILQQSLNIYPFLQSITTSLALDSVAAEETQRDDLTVSEESWTALGRSLLEALNVEQELALQSSPGHGVRMVLDQGAPSSPGVSRRKSSAKPHQTPIPQPLSEPLNGNSQNGDSIKEVVKSEQTTVETMQEPVSPVMTLPTRKRSLAQSETPEAGEGGRGRSKRIRARESNADEAIVDAAGNKYTAMEWQLFYPIEADTFLFDVLDGMAKKLGIRSFEGARGLRRLVTGDGGQTVHTLAAGNHKLLPALKCFYNSMLTWSRSKNQQLDTNTKGDENAIDSRHAGLMAYLDSAASQTTKATPDAEKTGVKEFITLLNQHWLNTSEAAVLWILCLIDAFQGSQVGLQSGSKQSSYLASVWPERLKETVNAILVQIDEALVLTMQQKRKEFLDMPQREDKSWSQIQSFLDSLQTLFELHLDVFLHLTNPASDASTSERLAQQKRLERWCNLARDCIQSVSLDLEDPTDDSLLLRHFWASVFHLQALDDIPKDHVIACIHDIRRLLSLRSGTSIVLPNNTSMPELSVAAADRELSKLETMDFFLSIFSDTDENPAALIERLEPLLARTTNINMSSAESALLDSPTTPSDTGSTMEVLSKFLENASAPLRLTLWQRLKEAYNKIDYPTKVLSIDLQCIGVLLESVTESSFLELRPAEREVKLLSVLRDCREPLENALKITENEAAPFECFDAEELRISMRIVSDLFMVMYAVSLYDDYAEATVKEKQMMNPFRTYPTDSFHSASIKFHDMQVKIIMLWYRILQEATIQFPELFSPAMDFHLEYLRNIHHALGARRLCKASDSLFLKFMKSELEKLSAANMLCSDDYAQVLFDLYDLNCFTSAQEKQDHGCEPDYLDRATAMELVDFVFSKAKNVNAKDWLKSEVVKSVEKLNSALGPIGKSFAAARNKRIYAAYLKSAVNPLELYRCRLGLDDLSAMPVSVNESPLAAKGWFFLRGQIDMAKYRASRQKATQSVDEDLEEAVALFHSDLEFSPERWESWLGLALANDGLIEEKVLWSAEDLNNKGTELAASERSSIHAYTMAISMANRNAEPNEETRQKLSELDANFALRIYASTRPPFSMAAFSTKDFPDKYCSGDPSGNNANGLYLRRPFKPLRSVAAWTFAASLLKSALREKPDNWIHHYMLGKCYWKLQARPHETTITEIDALREFQTAVDRLPDRKETGRSDPVLEPIYKVISTLDKLQKQDKMTQLEVAAEISSLLKRQSQFDVPKVPEYSEHPDWMSYMLDILKILRAADKAKWHHRVVMKSAHIMYDRGGRDEQSAAKVKDYLAEQHLYSTKTMAMTVWKPENERAGRHWVYMSQYVKFLVELLEATMDLEAIQTLARRVRKKNHDFYEHAGLWETVCLAHLRMHRKHANVPEQLDSVVFDHMSMDDFSPKAAQVDSWCQAQESSNPLLDVMREVADIKKINQGLMLVTPIDALLAETYAAVYSRIGPTLPSLPATTSVTSTPPAPAATTASSFASGSGLGERPPPTPERINIMSMLNVDGVSEDRPTPPPVAVAAAATSAPSEPAPRPRFRPVTKRELVKRASEASAQKIAGAQAGAKAKMADGSIKTTASRRMSATKEDGGPGESRAGSVQDDADDESELSELAGDGEGAGTGSGPGDGERDDQKARRMFSKLVVGDSQQEADSSAVQTDDEGAEKMEVR